MKNVPVNIACIGECMIELAPDRPGFYRQSYAGDTFNTAAYMARQFAPRIDVSYITGLGQDSQSTALRAALEAEGIRTDHITIVPDKIPGLYMIENDESGERSFQYWRADSAARQMFAGWTAKQIVELLSRFDLVYLSGITLAILDKDQRATLFAALKALSGSVNLAFDPNYRPALWPDKDECRASFEACAALCDFALITLDDHTALWDEASGLDCALRWQSWGADEVVVKEGGAECQILNRDGVIHAPPPQKLKPRDTTGAGDSFAAGYLGARILSASIPQAADLAHRIAGQVIMHPGGVIDHTVWQVVETDFT